MKISKWTIARTLATVIAAALLGVGAITLSDSIVVGSLVFIGFAILTAVILFAITSLGRSISRQSRQTQVMLRAVAKEASRSTYHASRSADISKQTSDRVKSTHTAGDPELSAAVRDEIIEGVVRGVRTAGIGANPSTPKKAVVPLELAPRSPKDPAPKGSGEGLVKRSHQHFPIEGDRLSAWVASRQGGPSFQHADDRDNMNRTSGKPFARDVPVAMIADDFTFNSFKDEFKTYRLTPTNWREVFEKRKPRMFFCESAWQGSDPKTHLWQGKIYASVRWPKENRKVLLEILDFCRKEGIPTVFWNKEDPTHFGDRINDFIRTAALFDYVFTTAEECVDGYKKDAAVPNVDVLPFAVQPKLFNPQGISDAEDNVNFAGTWYGMYQRRSDAAAQILDLVLESNRPLVIYDRMHSSPNPIYRYPERFQKYTRPAISFQETALAYKQSRFGITLNTVDDSRTMFARRVFELAASGSVVLSNTAVGVENFFGDSVIFADRDPQRFLDLTDSGYRELQRSAMHIALSNTYTHRAEAVLNAVGIAVEPANTRPAGLATVRTQSEYKRALEMSRGNVALDGLIVAVDPDGEQSLETHLVMQRDAGATVVGLDALRRGDYRTRSLLRTASVIRSNQAGDWPEPPEIEHLAAHASHYPGAIQFGSDGDRYTVQNRDDGVACYIPANEFQKEFDSDADQTAFQV